MGLPQVIIEFLHNAELKIKRGGTGVVALIHNENLPQPQIDEYKALVQYGGPAKLICETYQTDVSEALNKLQTKKWNYLVAPDADATGITGIKNWIIEKRNNKQTFKAVLPNTDAANEGIINFATTGIKVGEDEYTTQEFTCRIAGLIAGCPLDHSITYYPLGEVTEIEESADPDTDVDDGKLILINDGEKIKIARGINSLNVITPGKTEDYKFIKIIEGMDMILDDIRSSFEDTVVGIANSYDNKCTFLVAVNQYLRTLTQLGILYDGFDNKAEFDLQAIEEFLGSAAEGLSDEELKQADTKTWVFLKANVKFQNALEDLMLRIYI